jgi:hypothetical protein
MTGVAILRAISMPASHTATYREIRPLLFPIWVETVLASHFALGRIVLVATPAHGRLPLPERAEDVVPHTWSSNRSSARSAWIRLLHGSGSGRTAQMPVCGEEKHERRGKDPPKNPTRACGPPVDCERDVPDRVCTSARYEDAVHFGVRADSSQCFRGSGHLFRKEPQRSMCA